MRHMKDGRKEDSTVVKSFETYASSLSPVSLDLSLNRITWNFWKGLKFMDRARISRETQLLTNEIFLI